MVQPIHFEWADAYNRGPSRTDRSPTSSDDMTMQDRLL